MSYAPIRRGILDHIVQGKMTFAECAAYVFMVILADHETGVWHGSAKGLEFICGLTYRQARYILEKLEESHYIKRFSVQGKHGNYPILINKFELTIGNEKFRINSDLSETWQKPHLEPCQSFVDVIGKVNGNGNGNGSSPSQEVINNKARNKKIFTRPALGEVADYMREIGMDPETADEWLDHYNSNGWMVGKNPMKDWKATVRTWNRRRFGGNGNGNHRETSIEKLHRLVGEAVGEGSGGGKDETDFRLG